MRPVSWANLVFGGWLVIAPLVLTSNEATETAARYWNDIGGRNARADPRRDHRRHAGADG